MPPRGVPKPTIATAAPPLKRKTLRRYRVSHIAARANSRARGTGPRTPSAASHRPPRTAEARSRWRTARWRQPGAPEGPLPIHPGIPPEAAIAATLTWSVELPERRSAGGTRRHQSARQPFPARRRYNTSTPRFGMVVFSVSDQRGIWICSQLRAVPRRLRAGPSARFRLPLPFLHSRLPPSASLTPSPPPHR